MFFSFLFRVSFKLTNPITPAIKEESRMTNFALLIIVTSSKANKVTKIDIVKPIPPKNPTAKTDFQFKSRGSLQIPNFTAKKLSAKIPRGFPTISPNAIPVLYCVVKIAPMSELNMIAVLASANIGRMTKATGLCKKCCKTMEVDFLLPLPKGMAKANKTPVIVA